MTVLTRLKAPGMLVAFLAAAGPVFAGHQFEFTSRGDTVRHVAPGAVAEFGFSLTNTGTASDVYEFDCRVIQSVPSWYVTYCVGFH